MNKEKMMTSAKTLYTISRVAQKISLAAMIVLLIFSVSVLVIKDEGFITNSKIMEFGNLELELTDSALPAASIQRGRIAIGLAVIALICGFGSYVLRDVTLLLAPIADGRPFESGVSTRLRKLAILTLIGGAAIQLLQSLGDLLLTNAYHLTELFKEGMVQDVSVNFQFNFAFFFVAMFIGLLSFVFRYGEELQRESDETL